MNSKNLRFISSSLTVSLLVFACGSEPRLDATNSDTLSSSFKNIAQTLTEPDRQAFGQDAMLILFDSLDPRFVDLSTLYLSDYQALFSDDTNGHHKKLFSKISLEANALFHGKQKSDLANAAKQIRQRVYSKYAQEINRKLEDIPSEILQIKENKEKYIKALENAKKEKVALEEKRESTLNHITVSNFQHNAENQSTRMKLKISTRNIYDHALKQNKGLLFVTLKEHPSYRASFNVYTNKYGGIEPKGISDDATLNITLQNNSFVNDRGNRLPIDSQLPKSKDSYLVSYHGEVAFMLDGSIHKFDGSRNMNQILANGMGPAAGCDEKVIKLNELKTQLSEIAHEVSILAKEPAPYTIQKLVRIPNYCRG